jgi:colanic acid/amylovoran biosynthesis glycosyltransferase
MDGQKNKRIAVVTHKPDAYSETFIHAQIKFLPADLILHGGLMPSMAGKKPVLSAFKKKLNRITLFLFKKELFTREKAIIHLLKKEKIDVVLAEYGPVGVLILPVCRIAKVPLVVHFHGFDASHFKTLEKYAPGYKEMFEYAKAIIVVSEKMVEQIKCIGCPAHKIILNHYGVNALFFSARPLYESDNLFAMGRFVEKKGPEFTIRAFAKVTSQYPTARLYMAGDGPLLETCRSLVRELSLSKSVFFPGIIKHDMAPAFMQKSIAFVQHSIVAENGDSEGTPVAVMEASAAGLPVISTIHAGIPDVIIDGVTGILVPERNIDKMADAMRLILSVKTLARRMGEAGRERIQTNFTMERHISVLREALNK